MANELNASDFIKGSDKLAKEILDLSKAVSSLRKEFALTQELFNKTSKSQSELAKKTTAVQNSTEKLNDIEKERVRLINNINKANSNAIQKNEELRLQLQKQKKANKELAREKLGLIGAYEKESKRLIKLRKEYKDLAAAGKENTTTAKKLANEIGKLDSKLKRIDKTAGQGQRSVGMYEKATTKLRSSFVKVAGAIAAARGALRLTNDIINSSQASGDRLATTIGGLQSGWDFFKKSLSTADFSNFLTNMKEAIRVGKEYTKILDDLGDRNRDLAVTQAETNNEIERLKQVVDNVNLSNEQRIAAAKEINQLELQILEQTQSVREQAFNAETKRLAALTGFREEEILQFIKNYDEEVDLREKATAITEKETELAGLLFKSQQTGFIGYRKQIGEVKKELNSLLSNLDQSEKEYLRIFRSYSKTTDEELDKVTQTYVDLQLAEKEFLTGTRRSNNQLNTLIKQINKEKVKNTEDTESERTKIQVDAQLERIEANSIQVKSEEELQESLLITWEEYYKKKKALEEDDELSNKERLEKQKENAEFILDTISSLSDSFYDYRDSQIQSQIDNVERQRDAEVSAAMEAGEDTARIEEKYARKEAALRTEQAKADKRKALFDIAIATAVGIAKAIPNVALMAVAAALGAIQAGVVASKPLPKFEDGGDVGGKRHSQGGTIIEAEKGEYVVNRKGTSNAHALLELINSGLIKDGDLLPPSGKMFSGADTKELAQQNAANIIDIDPLVKGQQKMINAINNSQSTYDPNTLSLMRKKEGQRTKYIGTYFRG